MLALSRKPGEMVHLGGGISIVVLEVKGNRARLGVNAPRDVPIARKARTQAGTPRPTKAQREEMNHEVGDS